MLGEILVYGHAEILDFGKVFQLIIISHKSYVIKLSTQFLLASNDHKLRLGNV